LPHHEHNAVAPAGSVWHFLVCLGLGCLKPPLWIMGLAPPKQGNGGERSKLPGRQAQVKPANRLRKLPDEDADEAVGRLRAVGRRHGQVTVTGDENPKSIE